ncbi:sigma-54-dependent transcriptional regulator [Bauldia litoralis]|uniref:DNA-binding transcriptional regulator NtrC n=1 Tax=Bauldia litoralis TaxID=665467 RepID=A0A1G6A3V9_9HYPH|nr:sigma-54 dependent transcriptional regulator [Bauldia litoralis]SDB03114.1 DNA-binding transcriptional response regulator, NtrC family, contains REC, AAA-type ATPase, and a Fis-type DNA-binding domains [Bauldia litoralis]
MTVSILVVDDDPVQRRLLSAAIERFGYRPIVVAGGGEALARIAAADGDSIALIVLDLVMPDLDGMAVLAKLRETGRLTPVIVQTAHGGIDTVVNAMRAGAIDFVVKPVSPERLQVSIENALKLGALEGELARVKRAANGTLTFRDIITRSPAMDRVIRLGERAAASQIPILIEGESGVGKELIARAIQGTSERRSRPFVTVNCGAIPDNLVESILFGHEKGAFTGAAEKHAGKFREAHSGTLFLDEVGELPPDVQVKLLRALQDGEIDPVGARRPSRIDFRLISATNRSLIDLVKEGAFREDLYYRLNVFPIRVPLLRERREDIPELVRHFTARFAAEEGKPGIRGVSAEALDLLLRFDWPGNVRQLENAMFRAIVLADGAMLTPEEFPQIAALVGLAPPAPEARQPSVPGLAEAITLDEAPADQDPGGGNGLEPFDPGGDVRPLAEIEEAMIRLALERYEGRMTVVARKLGIGRSTLYRKLKELGIADEGSGIAAE